MSYISEEDLIKMIYKVKAKFNYDKAKEFLGRLRDGSIENQRPDGLRY